MSYYFTKYGKEFKKGLKRDHEKHKAFKATAPLHVATAPTVPGQTNFRNKMAPCDNQQQCGCCWDFSITNSLRSAFMLIGKDPGPLAYNYLLNNCGGVVSEEGCNGGDFAAGQNMLNGKGPWLNAQDPFTAQDGGQCKIGLPVAATAISWVVVGDVLERPTAQQLCEAIYANGQGRCLSVDVAADNTWSAYAGGIYDQNTSQEIDHMVRIVDYNAETSIDANGNAVFNADGSFKNGDGYFYVRNNWTSEWGEEGDMRSRYGANNLAETAMYFNVSGEAAYPPPSSGINYEYVVIGAMVFFALLALLIKFVL